MFSQGTEGSAARAYLPVAPWHDGVLDTGGQPEQFSHFQFVVLNRQYHSTNSVCNILI